MIRICAQCSCKYDCNRATSVLRYTYCTALCEGIALQFDLRRATAHA